MDLFGFLLIVSSFVELSVSAYLISIDKAYGFPISGLFFMSLWIISLTGGFFIFRLFAILRIHKLSDEHFKLSKKMSRVWSGKNNTITFVKKGRDWYCEGFGEPVKFNLRWFFFKKSFLFAFATRAMRYPIISKQLPNYTIGVFRLKGLSKKKIIKVEYICNNRVKTRTLVKNGVSKYGLISWAISKSNASPSVERGKPRSEAFGQAIVKYDEYIYCLH